MAEHSANTHTRSTPEGAAETRYALYFAPPAQSPLWRFGCAVIGYDAESGSDLPAPQLARFNAAAWREITAAPRRYGFHGTLKAPFRLAPGRTEAELRAAARTFAAERPRFACSGVEVAAIGRFLALGTVQSCGALNRLAAGAVAAFDAFRAPPTDMETARRLRAALTPRQQAYLRQWGYPYVLEEFRFHMTLTGALDEPERAAALAELTELFARSGADGPLIVGEVALYRQAGGPFRLLERFPLAA
ncbi:MAG TPA: DUF1045 domain-containing protein [Xanthobacteraceae bacterium]|nr:DUF1045 domain-containing protein [Xanthobacteraceae bacterium]